MTIRHAWVHPDDVVHDVDGAHRLVDDDQDVDDYGHRDVLDLGDQPVRTWRGRQRLIIVAEHTGPCTAMCPRGDEFGTSQQRRDWLTDNPEARIE